MKSTLLPDMRPRYFLLVLQFVLLIVAKIWFLRAGDNAAVFSWMYYPMGRLISLWLPVELSYSGFLCNFDFRSASLGGGISLNGCSAGGFFLAILGLSSYISLMWRRSRFVSSSKMPPESKCREWSSALLALFWSYVFSLFVLMLYNLYAIFGAGPLNIQMTLLHFQYPNMLHLPYPTIVKFLFLLCGAAIFAWSCRKSAY